MLSITFPIRKLKPGRESQVSYPESHESNWQTLKVRLPVTVLTARLPGDRQAGTRGLPSHCFILPAERGPAILKVTPPQRTRWPSG